MFAPPPLKKFVSPAARDRMAMMMRMKHRQNPVPQFQRR